MHFANPGVLLWLLLPLVFVVAHLVRDSRAMAKLKAQLGVRASQELLQSVSFLRRKWRVWLQFLCAVFLILSLARPQGAATQTATTAQGFELLLLVDVSESMLAEDVRPSRLEMAKLDLLRLLDRVAGNRVGIVAFAGSSAVLSPLTTDPGALRMYLESLSTLSVSTQGTSFRSALEGALGVLNRGGSGQDPTQKVSRVVLIASDGEDQEPAAEEFAEKLVEQGVRVFALVYGTEKGGVIPLRDAFGQQTGYKKDRAGNVVETKVKGDVLRELAKKGGGSFYFASPGGTYLENLEEDLKTLQKADLEALFVVSRTEFFSVYLALAILFGMLAWFLSERQSGSGVWRGRFQGSSAVGKMAAVLAFSTLSAVSVYTSDAQASWFSVERNNSKGKAALEKSQPTEALRNFSEALRERPFAPELQYNSALALDLLGKGDDSERAYRTAIQLADPSQRRFEMYFNLGELAARQKKIPEALSWYQEALRLKPDSRETKINIELLTQSQSQSGKGDGESKDQKDDQKDENHDDEQNQGNKKFAENQKQESKKDSGKELSQEDVRKILGELRQQEQKIRAEYKRREQKEQPRDKDW